MSEAVTNPEVVDLQFVLRGRSVPLDYADPLWQAIRKVLPWLADEPLAGVHPLYGLSPGGGEWYLSRRSHLNLRLPRACIDAARMLAGARLDLAAESIDVGAATERPFAPTPVLYSKFVTLGGAEAGPPDEARFFAACQAQLAALGLTPHSVVCGKRQCAATAQGGLHGFSLMVMGLDAEGTQRLRVWGLGEGRKQGCGIFVPHKSNPADGTLE